MALPAHILNIIKKNQRDKSPILDLSNKYLLEIPPEIFELTHLTTLYLSLNNLSSIKGLENLTNLTTLDLGRNKLSNINELENLTNLTKLVLNRNKLISIKGLENLTNLASLVLRKNNLSNIKELKNLKNLVSLDLRNNNLSNIKELSNLPNLRVLYLRSNPIQEVPIEVLNMDLNGEVDIDSFFNYFKQIEKQGVDYLYEAKLLIIGKGGAGKTSLLTKILDPSKSLPKSEESTHGIDIKTWKFPLGNQKEFRVNIWDFGGQAIYHATHRYFLTNNALYVLVVDVRKDSEQSILDLEIYWWLHAVEVWGGNSPVLLLQNDTGGRLLDIDMSALRKEFEFLDNQTHKINLSTVQNNEHEIFNRILEAFKYQFKQLPNFAKALPKIWLEIRQFIEEQQQTQNWMSLEAFLKVCAEKNITDEQDAVVLLSTFHELGICLWFQEIDLLRKTVILNPSWATNSAYAVLQNKIIKENFGRFNKQNLKEVWKENCFKDMRAELLDLMKQFELCYELLEKDHFIAPQLLENKQPQYVFDNKDVLQVYYSYDKFMPKGILHRLMVALHELIAQERTCVWLTGVLFERENAQAEVIEKYADRKIEIRVIGTPNDKRDLMSIILYEVDKINATFNNTHQLQVDKLIPCQCIESKGDPEYFSYQELKEFADDHAKIQCHKRGCRKMLNAQDLLDGISSKTIRRKPVVKVDKNQRLLEEKIAILEREIILETRAEEKLRLKEQLKELKKNSRF